MITDGNNANIAVHGLNQGGEGDYGYR